MSRGVGRGGGGGGGGGGAEEQSTKVDLVVAVAAATAAAVVVVVVVAVIESKVSALIFSQNSEWVWMKFCMLARPVTFENRMLNLFCTINVQEKERYLRDSIQYTFNTGLRSDVYEASSFKLSCETHR